MGITEGISLLLIIPLLGIAGIEDVQSSGSSLVEHITSIFESTGISLSVVNVLILYTAIMSLFALLRYYQTINTASINQRVVVYWRNAVFQKLSLASWSSIQSIKNSDLQNTLTLEIRKFGSISNQMIQLLGTLVLIMVYLTVSAFLSLELTILAIIPVLLMVLINRPINKKSFVLGNASVGFNQQLQSIIMGHLNALKLVKSYGKESQHSRDFEESNRDVEQKVLEFTKATQKTRTLFEIIAAVIIAIYIYIAIVIFETAVTELLLLIFIFARLLPKATRLINNYQQILNYLPAVQWTHAILEKLSVEEKDHEGQRTRIRLRNEITFKDIDFSYGSNKVLEKLNLSIPALKTTVLKGGSGAGKSTTVDLILGLHKPKSGAICIDGVPLKEINSTHWKAGIAYVPQEAFLFHKSIKENLRWVNPSIDEDAMWVALVQAGAADFVKLLPKGLETIVGDRGANISGGERQRIALARALIRQPDVLILDEATNAVDDKNELLIKDALQQLHGKMTIVIVAHRSSLVDLADHVIELS